MDWSPPSNALEKINLEFIKKKWDWVLWKAIMVVVELKALIGGHNSRKAV
jgi:hypothetical protein